MTDFLITQMTLYPWFTWLLVFFAAMGAGYAAVWAYKIQLTAFAWLGYRRQVWLAKAAVRRQLIDDPLGECPVCDEREMEAAERLIDEGYDPPEYQYPDDDEPELPPEPSEDEVVAFLAKVKAAGYLEEERAGPPVCEDPECDKYGWVHPPPCLILPTMPVPKYTGGAAMPPQPVREYLHPAVMDDLSSAGFSEHETTDGAVDSIYTRAMAREVEAMVTDGIIPTSEEEKR